MYISPLAKLLTIHIFVFPESKVNSVINFGAHQRAVCRLFSQQRLDAFTADKMRVCYASGAFTNKSKRTIKSVCDPPVDVLTDFFNLRATRIASRARVVTYI